MTDTDPAEAEIMEKGSALELAALEEQERIIEAGLNTFTEVGFALLRIQEGKHYRAAGYRTFETYCRQRWDMGRQYAYRIMDASQIAAVLSPQGDTLPPNQERQMRELAPLRDDPDKLVEVWAKAVEASEGRQPPVSTLRKAVAEVTGESPEYVLPKGDGEISHPAPYSQAVLNVIAELLVGYPDVLDPFAGTGRIFWLADEHGHNVEAIEIEQDWAEMEERTKVGDATKLKYADDTFDAIATSPTYGNRYADQYEADDPRSRSSYAFDLGHNLQKNNSGAMQWGTQYRKFHEIAWHEAYRVLRSGGRFVLNIKDHYRDGQWQDVSGWHVETLVSLGLRVAAIRPVVSRGVPRGDNFTRVPAELVIALDKP